MMRLKWKTYPLPLKIGVVLTAPLWLAAMLVLSLGVAIIYSFYMGIELVTESRWWSE